MQSHYYHLYYPDYPLKMSIGTAVEAVKEGASEPNSTEKVVKEGGILQDVGQEEVKTSTTKKNALEAEQKRKRIVNLELEKLKPKQILLNKVQRKSKDWNKLQALRTKTKRKIS